MHEWVVFYYLKTKFPATCLRFGTQHSRNYLDIKIIFSDRIKTRIQRECSLVTWGLVLTNLYDRVVCATWWIQRNPTSQKELPGMEQSAYDAEPRLTTVFVFLRFYQVAIHTVTWSIQFTSHMHALIRTLVCPLHRKSSGLEIIVIRQPPNKHPYAHMHINHRGM